MVLVWQMYGMLVNLPNFSSCYSKFIKSIVYIFETSVEYICCGIRSADNASGEVVKCKRLV